MLSSSQVVKHALNTDVDQSICLQIVLPHLFSCFYGTQRDSLLFGHLMYKDYSYFRVRHAFRLLQLLIHLLQPKLYQRIMFLYLAVVALVHILAWYEDDL